MVDLVQREVPRERRVPHGRADELRNHQEAFTIVPNITKTCSILLSLRKGTREKMIRKEGDTKSGTFGRFLGIIRVARAKGKEGLKNGEFWVHNL